MTRARPDRASRDLRALYPFMAYGTDGLAFAHIVIAMAFLGPLRGIPLFWWLIDCSFRPVGDHSALDLPTDDPPSDGA